MPAYAVDECTGSPKTIVLPDCTEIEVTTCFCDSGSSETGLVVCVEDTGNLADEGENGCEFDGDLAATCFIDGAQRRNGKSGNGHAGQQ